MELERDTFCMFSYYKRYVQDVLCYKVRINKKKIKTSVFFNTVDSYLIKKSLHHA